MSGISGFKTERNDALMSFNYIEALNEAKELVKNRFDGFKIYQNGELLTVGSLGSINEVDFKIVLELPNGKAVHLISLLKYLSEDEITGNGMEMPDKKHMYFQNLKFNKEGGIFVDGLKKSGKLPARLDTSLFTAYYYQGFLAKGRNMVDCEEDDFKLNKSKPIFR